MALHFFVKDVKANNDRLKGKTITQFSKHLESEGWPSEFPNEEARDRVKCAEKRNYYSLKPHNYKEVSERMGLASHRYGGSEDVANKQIAELAASKGCVRGDCLTRRERKRLSLDKEGRGK